jgi:NAD(P)H dehydrogenase (quinone)
VRVLVVFAHPRPDSFGAAVRDAAVHGLRYGGHIVEVADLYADGFQPVMSADERLAYDSDDPLVDPLARSYAEKVRWAQALVFVYPTWWSSLPAMLKGFLEKVFVSGVAFRFDEDHRVKPNLKHIRRIVGISTYGSPRTYVRVINDNGRRILLRALRLNTGVLTRAKWFGFYAIDSSTEEQRRAFLQDVERGMAKL